jgi:hypothetical protein
MNRKPPPLRPNARNDRKYPPAGSQTALVGRWFVLLDCEAGPRGKAIIAGQVRADLGGGYYLLESHYDPQDPEVLLVRHLYLMGSLGRYRWNFYDSSQQMIDAINLRHARHDGPRYPRSSAPTEDDGWPEEEVID